MGVFDDIFAERDEAKFLAERAVRELFPELAESGQWKLVAWVRERTGWMLGIMYKTRDESADGSEAELYVLDIVVYNPFSGSFHLEQGACEDAALVEEDFEDPTEWALSEFDVIISEF